MKRLAPWMIVSLLAPCVVSGAENWNQWRGPELTGVSKTARPPLEWSEDRNIRWKTPLPAWGGATPVVWDDRVFVTSPSERKTDAQADDTVRRFPRGGRENPGGTNLLLMCVNRRDGKVMWRRTLDDGNRLYGKQNMSSPSPVTDGKHVWALTGTGVVSCFDMSGKEIWKHDLAKAYGAFRVGWGYASSPLLFDGKVIIEVLHTGQESPSYLVAFGGADGRELWRVERKTDARWECPDAYTTPTLLRAAGEPQIVVTGADYVTAHSPRDGREIWRASGLNPDQSRIYRIVASPVAADDRVFAFTRVKPVLALGAGGRGDVTASHLAWKYEGKGAPDVPTPVWDGKYLYMVDDQGIIVCLEGSSGSVVWGPERTTTGTVSASPVLADGRIYVTNESAETTVLKAGPKFEVLGRNALDDGYTISSMALADGDIILRSSSHLYCISAP